MSDARTGGKDCVLGWQIWQGPSELDGQPIVAIATRFSGNDKTGQDGSYYAERNMIQTWILRSDMSPAAASKCDADVSVCGDCPMRKGGCYVNIAKAPGQVWRAWKRGRYESTLDAGEIAHRAMRVGSYGDPTAVPFEVFEQVLTPGWTGYTHQWRKCDQRWQQYLMASVESAAEMHEAQAAGWRTFRVRLETESPIAGEINCPSAATDGKAKCIDCQLCDGTAGKARLSICIPVHGRDSGLYVKRATA